MKDADNLLTELFFAPILVSLILIPIGTTLIQNANLPAGYTVMMYILLFSLPAFLIWSAAKSIAGSVLYGILWFISSCFVANITGDMWTPVVTIILTLIIAYSKRNDR